MQLPEYAYFAGASIIEKHICLGRASEPYDYFSSLEPDEFSRFVGSMRALSAIQGSTEITDTQRNYLKAATYAISKRALKEGDLILADDIQYRRTGQKDILTPELMAQSLPAIASATINEGEGITAANITPLSIVACVPCRMKSTRLKQKAMREIVGLPSIERCLINAAEISYVNRVVLLTSTHPDDNPLEEFAKNNGYECIRGNEMDVMQRMLLVQETYNPDILLRITGDCPVVSFEAMEHMISEHVRHGADASYCHENVAVGLVGDVYSSTALLKLRSLVPHTDFSEYLIMYFVNNPDHFKSLHVVLPERFQHPEWRLTLDEAADLDLLQHLYRYADIGKAPLSFNTIERFFAEHPEAAKINGDVGLAYKDREALVQEIKTKTTIAKAS